jgi:hypothetical protein
MKTKDHLVIPRDILEEVDQIAGKRKEAHLLLRPPGKSFKGRFLKLWKKRGAWSDKNHPT